ncbi:MAG: hypothetical protein ABJK25_11140 [Halieaceae bacterium]
MSLLTQLRSRYRQTENPLQTQRYLELAVVLVTLLFLLLLVLTAVRLAVLTEPATRLPAPGSLVVADAVASGVVTSEMRGEITSRPLFFPSRRPLSAEPPPAPVVKESGAQKSELDKVKLLGVFGGGESAGVILLVEGKKQRILIGEEVKGWKLKSVDLNQVQFSSGGKLETLVLQYSGAKAAGNGAKR